MIVNNLGQLYFKLHRYADAESLYRRALEIRERSLGPNHPDLIETLNAYAVLLKKTKRKQEAEVIMFRAEKIATQTDRTTGRTVDVRAVDQRKDTWRK